MRSDSEPEPTLVAEPKPVPALVKGRGAIRNEFILIAIVGLVLLGLIALEVEGLPAPLPVLRLLLGLAFVLLVPGYALQAALFPRADDLDGLERLALSIGLSIAVVPPLALILDQLHWGIRLWPIVIGEGGGIAICAAIAWLRRRRLPQEERPVLAVDVDLRGWWAAQDRAGQVLYGVIAGAFLLAALSAIAIVALPKPGERLTEFYVLGAGGLAEDYPRQAIVGQPLMVTVGIANREGIVSTYRVEVRVGGQPIGGTGPAVLQDGEVWEQAVLYALPAAGDDQQVEFTLYRDGGSEPYRSLRLWIDVVDEEQR
jgi:uncharacterized membrane protein